jgi:hypothetical protein
MRNVMFKLLTVFTVFEICFSVEFSFAQSAAEIAATTIGAVSISSPTAAALGKYGDIPISYHTGIPNIDIPLYTVESGSLKLPISLSYHASGLKVQEPASWVGAGWSLNAGGVITRTVMGQPDESGTNSGAQTNGFYSHYGYNNYLYANSLEDWVGFAEGRKDGQPDLYFFNFNGYTGKFYFRDDRTPVIVPEQDLTIIPHYSGGRSLDSFKIITPNGDQYYFGNSPISGDRPLETTDTYSTTHGDLNSLPVSSWYLDKIVSADNQFVINLTYTAEIYGCYNVAMFAIDGIPNPTQPYEYDLVKNLIAGVRLSQINFPNGTVNFSANTQRTDLSDNQPNTDQYYFYGPNRLDSIQINSTSGFCKNYRFSYGYFSGDATPLPNSLVWEHVIYSDEQRLRLDSVQEYSCDQSAKIPPYKFTYFGGQVPRRLSFGIDHWGLYNGVNNNPGLIPTLVVNGSTVPGANRDAGSLAVMEAGTLNKITYPTGGSSTMVFETNSVFTTSSYVQSGELTSLYAHMVGQSSFTASGTYASNGQQITVTLDNSTDNYSATCVVTDSTGATFYSTTIPNNTSFTQTFTAHSGTFTALITVNSAATGGLHALLTQNYTVYVTGNTPVGGLRIASIINSDGISSNTNVTNYTYNNASGYSTAYIYSVPVYAQMIRNDIIKNEGYYLPSSPGFVNDPVVGFGCPSTGDYYKSPNSIRPMASFQGNSFGYQTVTVTQPGNGYSIYNYYLGNSGYSFQNGDIVIRNIVTYGGCASTVPNYPPAPVPFDSKRGELASEQHFNNNGQLLKDVYYYPVYDTLPTMSTPAFIVTGRNVAVTGTHQLLGTIYSLNTVKKTSMMTVQDDFQPGVGFVTKTSRTYYGSKFHTQPTRSVVNTSTGDSLLTLTAYSTDYRIPNCDAIADCSVSYNTACASCLATYNAALINPTCSTSNYCLSNAFLAYNLCRSNARVSYTSCRQNYLSGSSSSYQYCITNTESSADANLKPVLQLQDEGRVVPIEVTEWKNANLLHADYTNYGYAAVPAGIPFPSKTQLINLQAPSSTFTISTAGGGTITKDSRYLDETYYTFNAGNPVQALGHNGTPDSYVWDYLNTKPIAKVTNATSDQIAFTSFEADGTGGWTISGAASTDVSSLTGSKDYNLSAGAISKSGLNTTKSFVVSYWSKSGAATVNSTAATTTFSKNGWYYYEHVLPAGTSTVTITGSVTIDELRLYPSDAQMTSYTYKPLVGISTVEDVDNHISYYQYDALGRLTILKDQDGNIIRTIQYQYNGPNN